MERKEDIKLEQAAFGQPQIERAFSLLRRLVSGIYYTREELQEGLCISRSTFMRYIHTLRAAGFDVECLPGGRYRIARVAECLTDFSQIVHFSREEAFLIDQAIDCVCPTNRMKANLKNKLLSIYHTTPLHRYSLCKDNGEIIDAITEGIQNHECVLFSSYCSSNSGDIRDRIVEPIEFTADCRNVVCMDLECGMVKLFSPYRMKSATRLEKRWTHTKDHAVPETDIFDMSGDRSIGVRLLMKARARNLMEEEWPKSVPYIMDQGNGSWMLNTRVCSVKGIGRFVLGLPDDVEILEGDELREYVRVQAVKWLRK